jgi:hypothetical protein
VVPQSLGVEGAIAALGKKIKDLHAYIKKNQFEFLSHEDVYLNSGVFNPHAVLAFYLKKEKEVLSRGFSGLCVSGDASWTQEGDWDKLNAYEKRADKFISQRKIKALCTYSAEKFNMNNMFSLSFSHDLIIRKKDGEVDILMDKRDLFK